MTTTALLAHYDALLSDLDGVVYAGPFAIEGAPEALNRAEEELNVPVIFVTNNASRSVESVAEHLRNLGVHTRAERIVSSAQAGAKLLAQQIPAGSKVLITGTEALADCVRDAGLEPVRTEAEGPIALIQGFDPKMGWEDLAEASYTLANPEVLWVATNTDQTIPKERGQAPGNGTLVAAVAIASRRTPLVAGKPEAPIFHTAAQALNSERPVIVGDRLDTDILGANNAQMDGALVLTGVQTYRDVIEAVPEQRPTYVLRTLDDFFAPYPEIEVLFEGYEVIATGPTWQARVRSENQPLPAPKTLTKVPSPEARAKQKLGALPMLHGGQLTPSKQPCPSLRAFPVPKRDEATNAEAEKIENDRSIADAEFERKLAAVLATDPVERVKRLETMSEQLEKDLDNLS